MKITSSGSDTVPDPSGKSAEKAVALSAFLTDAKEQASRQPPGIKSEEDEMNRMMIVADLKEGAHDQAERLLREGPPFDPEALGLHRHAAYLTGDEVIFVFEAADVERILNDLLDDMTLAPAVMRWDKLTEGLPRIAYECFYWSPEANKLGVGLGT